MQENTRRDEVWGADPESVLVTKVEATRIEGEEPGTGEILVEIEQTRAVMGETIDAIQRKLSPETLADQAKGAVQDVTEQVRESVREAVAEAKGAVREATLGKVEQAVSNAGETAQGFGAGVIETIRRNPIPAALAGLSIGWLIYNSRKGASRFGGNNRAYPAQRRAAFTGGYAASGPGHEPGYAAEYERGDVASEARDRVGQLAGQTRDTAGRVVSQAQDAVGQFAGQAQETAGQVAGQVQETAGQLAGQARETAGQLADGVQQQAQRAQDLFQRTLRENPLALGAVALALGSAVGLSLPKTAREDQLLGELRDNLVGKAQEVAQETMDKVQQVAQEAGDAAKEEAQQQGLIGQKEASGTAR
jgi:ElaB/YqjD/DUF883 family membrane-anchored ribosome-binding protein